MQCLLSTLPAPTTPTTLVPPTGVCLITPQSFSSSSSCPLNSIGFGNVLGIGRHALWVASGEVGGLFANELIVGLRVV